MGLCLYTSDALTCIFVSLYLAHAVAGRASQPGPKQVP